MSPARFIWTAHGLLLETPVPLTARQRQAAARFALAVNKQRHANLPAGDRREVVGRVIEALEAGNFTERPIPRSDSERESVIYG